MKIHEMNQWELETELQENYPELWKQVLNGQLTMSKARQEIYRRRKNDD